MPRLSFRSQVMHNSMDEVSVVDVYDLASDIGAECEKIIDLHGSGAVKTLIPKCIVALEMLEALASKNEQETSLIQELNDRIAKLEDEKVERAETKKKFEKEIETIEEAWRCETRELVAMVSRLQSDNLRLSQEQKQHKDYSASENLPDTSKYEDGMIQKLKEQVDKQRNELKLRDKDLLEKSEKNDQFILEIDQLKHQSQESKKRFKTLQNQVKTLCEERADFLAKIQDQHKETMILKKQLGIAEKENEDLGREESSTPRFTIAELKEVLNERNDLKNRVNDLEEELLKCRPKVEPPKVEKKLPEPEEEAPVQGPLPEEWYTYEDSWKRKNSDTGIRKFFRKLFTDNEGSFPKRSLSSLTKMTLSSSGPHSDIPI